MLLSTMPLPRVPLETRSTHELMEGCHLSSSNLPPDFRNPISMIKQKMGKVLLPMRHNLLPSQRMTFLHWHSKEDSGRS